jgi:hypothetical protein
MGTTADDWNVGGNVAVTGTCDFTGAVTLTGAITVGGNATVTGTLDVTGATSLNSTLYVSGGSDFDGNVDMGSQAWLGGSNATGMIGTNYAWMYLDGTNRPAFSSIQLYDVGTGSMVSVYASNGVVYAQ